MSGLTSAGDGEMIGVSQTIPSIGMIEVLLIIQ
jgi:hypothetical protein